MHWSYSYSYWWAKIRGLADIPDFEELERFSKQKKSPIGYEVFLLHVMHENDLINLHISSHSHLLRYVWIVAATKRLSSTFQRLLQRAGADCT